MINKDNPDLLDDYRKSMLDTSTYLIRRITTIETFDADPNGVITSLRSPLNVRPLIQLLDMYRFHEVTKPHDKVFALLGTSSDTFGLRSVVQDYQMPFKTLFHRVARHIFGPKVGMVVWEKEQVAVILARRRVCGRVGTDARTTNTYNTTALGQHGVLPTQA